MTLRNSSHDNATGKENREKAKVYYHTTSICPTCGKLLPADIIGRRGGVFVSRTCPDHGLLEGLTCSDTAWYENLHLFDVPPTKPPKVQQSGAKGCPQDCGLCPEHLQMAGTVAIEITNHCDAACPICLGDNQGTFELTPAEVGKMADGLLARQPHVDAFTLSGGEPTTHPRLFEIVEALHKPGITRIVINTNGKRIAQDDAFLDELAKHPEIYVCLHYDGPNAERLRGIPHSVQEKALRRLESRGIKAIPLALGVREINGPDLGSLTQKLLTEFPQVKSVFLTMMAWAGKRGSAFPLDPKRRLTIPEALELVESGSGGKLRKRDFIPLTMPNPLCAAIGYFLVQDGEITPLMPLVELEEIIEITKNSHFVRAGAEMEAYLRKAIDGLHANPERFPDPERVKRNLRKLLKDLFPENRKMSDEERKNIAEDRIKTVYLMQFMDPWTFDSKRMMKCSCQHLLPDNRVIPSCGYYSLHRKSDPRFKTS